jgi:hypothetical protein
MTNDALKLYTLNSERAFVLTDHPYRENRNSIDQLLMRAKEYSCSEHLKFFIIGEYVRLPLCRPKLEKIYRRGFTRKFAKCTSQS